MDVYRSRMVAVATEVRETIAGKNSRSDSVTVDMNQKHLLLAENAPLAKQESFEEEEMVININEDKLHNPMNGDQELSYEVNEEPQIVVIPEATAEFEVSSIDSPKPLPDSREIKVQISEGTNHKNIYESPVNEPIILLKHKAQVLQEPLDKTDHSAQETFQPNDVPHSHKKGIEKENCNENNDQSTLKRSNFSTNKDWSDLIVTVENTPDEELLVTEKLPEVLLVAEQLPERLKAAKNILAREPSKEKEPTAPPYESSEIDDAGSTLTIGRGDTAVTDLTEILQTETAHLRPSEDRVGSKTRRSTASENESCISPFFIGIYSFLGVLIVIMIGLNFWFGFHLLFFIGLLAVIALFSCVLTEFNDFHNEPD